MQIYHSNTIEITVPKLTTMSRNGDFGTGIYMFEEKEHARLQAGIIARREDLPFGVVSFFETPIGLMSYSALRIKKFPKPSIGWLDFILKNRRCPQKSHSYDIVSGPALDDNAYACLNAFESGFMERDELIQTLKSCKLPNQILFHTAKSLLFLDFSGKEKVACPKK
jgi:hypothetical protein